MLTKAGKNAQLCFSLVTQICRLDGCLRGRVLTQALLYDLSSKKCRQRNKDVALLYGTEQNAKSSALSYAAAWGLDTEKVRVFTSHEGKVKLKFTRLGSACGHDGQSSGAQTFTLLEVFVCPLHTYACLCAGFSSVQSAHLTAEFVYLFMYVEFSYTTPYG